MGFRTAGVTEVHRLDAVHDGNVLQLDFLFEREPRRPSQHTLPRGREDLLEWLGTRKARSPGFTVVGAGSAVAWPAGLLDATVGAGGRDAILRHVARHGRFAWSLASLGGDDPAAVLELLPLISDAGSVSAPRGILGAAGDGLVLAPNAEDGPRADELHVTWRGALAFTAPGAAP
jgi:hypothetical protein